MQTAQQPFPVHVRTGWIDYSPALHWYATQKVRSALRSVASRIRAVTVRIADHEPHDPSTRLCAIDVSVKPTGTISATSTGRNVCELIDHAADAAVEKLREQQEVDVVHQPLSRIA
jgi:ribosome-associated translation inhibitor RaiA